MIHYLRNDELDLLLKRIRKKISPKGRLVIRATIPRKKRPTFLRLIELAWIKINGLAIHYRTAGEIARAIKQAGFSVSIKDSSNKNREEKWFVCKPAKKIFGVKKSPPL